MPEVIIPNLDQSKLGQYLAAQSFNNITYSSFMHSTCILQQVWTLFLAHGVVVKPLGHDDRVVPPILAVIWPL